MWLLFQLVICSLNDHTTCWTLLLTSVFFNETLRAFHFLVPINTFKGFLSEMFVHAICLCKRKLISAAILDISNSQTLLSGSVHNSSISRATIDGILQLLLFFLRLTFSPWSGFVETAREVFI